MMGRGYHILYIDMHNFINTDLREPQHCTDHRMILAVLQGEGEICNCRYQCGQNLWPIKSKAERPRTEGETSFKEIKGDITKTPWPTMARASCISQDT